MQRTEQNLENVKYLDNYLVNTFKNTLRYFDII